LVRKARQGLPDLKEFKVQWGLEAIRDHLDLKVLLGSREFKALWEQ